MFTRCIERQLKKWCHLENLGKWKHFTSTEKPKLWRNINALYFILAYANKVAVMTENEENLIDFLDKENGNLSENELTINYNKTPVMINHPFTEKRSSQVK